MVSFGKPRLWISQAGLAYAVAIIIAILFLVFAYVPIPQTVQYTFVDATGAVNVDSRFVLSQGCVNVTWRIEGIRAVYLNDEPTVGEGAEQLCIAPNEDNALQIQLQTDDIVEIPIPVTVVVSQVWAWVLLFVGILAFVYATAIQIGKSYETGRPLQRVGQVVVLVLIGMSIAFLLLEGLMRLYFNFAATDNTFAN